MFAYACIAALALVSIAGLADGAVAIAVAQATRNQPPQQRYDRALDAAAREFRVQIYNTYREDRAEFERRRAAWDQAQARWRDAGSRPEEQPALIRWLQEATEQSRPAVRGLLPEIPLFGPSAAQSERQVEHDPPAKPHHAARPNAPPIATNINPTPPSRAETRSARPSPWNPPRRVASPPSESQAPNVSAGRLKPRHTGAPVVTGDVASPARPTGNANPLITKAHNVPATRDGTNPAFDVVQPLATPNSPATRSELPTPPTLGVNDPLAPPDSPAIATPPVRAGNAMPQTTDTAPPRRIALAKPTTPPAAQDVPGRLVISPRTTDTRPLQNIRRFNLGELWARASGYTVGLRTVDSALHEEAEFSPSDLAALLDELEDLLSRRRDLLLYEQLVGAADRERLLQSLAFPQVTVAGLGSRIAQVRERLGTPAGSVAGGNVTGGSDPAERDRQLQLLEELSLRLSKLHQQ